MTTETITSDPAGEPPNGVRFIIRKQYNSAWSAAAPSGPAGPPDSTMDTKDGSRAPLELRAFIDSIPAFAWSVRPDGSPEFVNGRLQDYTGLSSDQLYGNWTSILHPDEAEAFKNWWQALLNSEKPGQTELRLRRFDGKYRWFQISGEPVHDEHGNLVRWCGINVDIDDRKRAEQELRKSEEDLRTITDAIRQPITVLAPDGTTLYANRVSLDHTGLTMGEVKETGFVKRACHPDDVDHFEAARRAGLLEGAPFELEGRFFFKNGLYRWQLFQYNPLKDESGQVIRWYVTATDIDDRKRAEQELQKKEEDLRTIVDAIRQFVVVLAPDGSCIYANRVALENTGLTDEDLRTSAEAVRPASVSGELVWHPLWRKAGHPDDVDRYEAQRRDGFSGGAPFELEARIYKTGQYRWQLFQYNPLKDESGQIIRWYVTATDIDDQKKTEERLRNENFLLREEIDRSSMFEEIVGSSKPMRQVLTQVEKVAPSDSTVLILGETGTGKELIARALHRRSRRANRVFVRVNCAAIPQSLIASELFGHEKGAFTGALQRRLGRFEAADGGTLFLDEIGELPMETQIALLRVLQEREFERVGSNHPIKVDVRLIAATNRDLPAAVAAGTFRKDLFYRLNVFPIAVPSLRDRAEDVPLLVEYFAARYANAAGKNIRQIAKHTLEQLRAYHWPGNIRELQNVVERAVILSETDTFVVDESWLKREQENSSQPGSPSTEEGHSTLADREVEIIESALAESHGRIAGPSGAAAKLGIPRQTLESKIKRLGIDKYGQKRPSSK